MFDQQKIHKIYWEGGIEAIVNADETNMSNFTFRIKLIIHTILFVKNHDVIYTSEKDFWIKALAMNHIILWLLMSNRRYFNSHLSFTLQNKLLSRPG